MKLDIKKVNDEYFFVTVLEQLTKDDFIIKEKVYFKEEFVKRPLAIVEYSLTLKPEILDELNKINCKFYIPYSNTPRETFWVDVQETVSKSKDPDKYIKNKEKAMGVCVYRSIQEKDALIEKEIKYVNSRLQDKIENLNHDYTNFVVAFYTGDILKSEKNTKIIKDFINTDDLDSDLHVLNKQIAELKKKQKELETAKHNKLNSGMLAYCQENKLDVPEVVFDVITTTLKDNKGFSKYHPTYSPWG